MDQQIVSAAKWFGGSLVAASLVMVIGGYCIISDSTKQLSRALVDAGNASRSAGFAGTVQLVTPQQLQIAPFEIRTREVK